MKATTIKYFFFIISTFFVVACEDGFLDRTPLDTPSLETFWETPEQAEMWVNNLYIGLRGVQDAYFEGFSDNGFGRAGAGANNIATGLYDTSDPTVNSNWDYQYIRLSLEFFENIGRVPNLSEDQLNELSGQVRFMLAYHYYRLITLYRDVPLVTRPLTIEESDVPVTPKEEVLDYILEQLEFSISNLPETWPVSENGRITKGAALALKARVLLYNERWSEAADAAKAIMEVDLYELHPEFGELFLSNFNNGTKEVILARQYAENVNFHELVRTYAPVYLGGFALTQPTNELQEAFEMADGSKFDWSNPVHAANPFTNRDPRFYHTVIWHGRDYNGVTLDLTGSEFRFSFTYIYFLKYVADLENNFWQSHVNWIIFRYADVLLMYAEAQNEASGPDESIYEALDLIRSRAGMPPVDRTLYHDQASLRELIRNERRVELAGEGLRYFDIIRWRIAEDVLNGDIKGMDLDNWTERPLDENGNSLLPVKPVQSRVFDPSKHYVWPIPQNAIDRSENLEQHPEW